VVGKKDEMINVSFTSPYAEEAANIVNNVVDAYITAHNERKRNTLAEVVKLLKEEKVKAEDELTERLKAMADYETQHENLAFGTSPESNIILTELVRCSAELGTAKYDTIDSQSYYQAIQKMAANPLALRRFVETQRNGIYVASADEATALRADLLRLRRARADSLHELKSSAPQIAALDAELQRLEQQVTQLDSEFAASVLAAAQERSLEAQAKQALLQAAFDAQCEEAVELNNQLVLYAILQSEYERTKNFADILDDRIRVISVGPQAASLNVEIIEVAEPSAIPSQPQKARTMGLAMCLGLFAGVGLGLLREWKDQRLRSTQEISALLGLPVLGAVPAMTSPKQTVAIRGQKVRISPESRTAEAFRTVRTAVFFGAPKDEARTILITSPIPGEGKTTTVSNLAIAMAQAGQKTLVLDADFRRPTQHRIFSLDRRAKGLSSVLAGEIDLDEAIEHLGVENLDVLTCGPDVPNPAEMLNSNRFAEIITTLARQYDRILIDSPPVIAVTDAQILAALCDLTVLVLRAEKSTCRVSMQACESLLGVDGRILGVIVNDVPRKGDRYGYYGYASTYGYYSYSRGGNGHTRKKEARKNGAKENGTRIQDVIGYGTRRKGGRPTKDKADLTPDEKDGRIPFS